MVFVQSYKKLLPHNIVRVNKSRRLGWESNVTRMQEGINALDILTSKHTGKRPVGRPRCR